VIRLIAQDEEMLAALESPDAFRERYGADIAPHLDVTRDVVGTTLEFLGSVESFPPWIGYLCIDVATDEVIGAGSFKGGPDAEDCVEIAYYTFPEFEGRGFGTETAGALVELAREQEGVRAVLAHTLPEANASTRILGKLDFVHLGEVEDPEDGRVWRWRQAL